MNRNRIQDLLILFGLPDSFSEQQLKQAYRDLVQVWHPDRHTHNHRLQRKSNEKLKEINEGERILSGLLVNGRFDLGRWSAARQPDGSSETRAASAPGRQSSAQAAAAGDGKAVRSPQPFPWRFAAFGLVLIGVLAGFVAAGRHAPVAASPAPAAVAPLKKSPRLDERNGFKQFTFGMSRAQAEAIASPDLRGADGPGSQATLTYRREPVARVGDYPLDRIELRFFRDQLYRIEIFFSRNQDKVYQAFADTFGDSNENGVWTRNGHALRARFWEGENVICTILAEKTSPAATGWDTVVLSDRRLSDSAEALEREELKADFTPDGFKGLSFGMSLADVQSRVGGRHLKPDNDAGIDETSLSVPHQSDSSLVSLGLFPLDEIRCHFFQDQLYRIDLFFSKNSDEISQAFLAKFPQATPNSSWLRGRNEMTARQWTDASFGAAILAPKAANPEWDRVILFQPEISKAQRRFQDEAPLRAAKDI